jgi:hypothetical protein
MPQVFTIFNHGTDFHRDKDKDEVITLLHNAAFGTEARIEKKRNGSFALKDANPSHLICEGPGSDTVSQENSASGVAHAHPGQLNPIFDVPKTPLRTPFHPKRQVITMTPPSITSPRIRLESHWEALPASPFRKSFLGQTESNSQTSGRIWGTGWDDSVYRAVWMLTHLKFERGMDIQKVNLVGWSRGAVTCIKQANKLYEVFGDTLELNIFAIDPVPGGLTTITEDIRLIPPNVRNFLAVLALDDDRSNFQPLDANSVQVMRPSQGTALAPSVHFLPLPGNHSDVVFPTKGNAPLSGRLCLHLAYKFLKHHGTRFANAPAGALMTIEEVFDAYEELLADRAKIRDAAASAWNDFVGGFKRKERQVRKALREYVFEPHLWVNEHHRMCALAPNLQAPLSPVIQLSQGAPYKPWQGLLPQMGITYKKAPEPWTLNQV